MFFNPLREISFHNSKCDEFLNLYSQYESECTPKNRIKHRFKYTSD